MTRRLQHYDVPEWRPWLIVAAVGAVLILFGIFCQIMQIAVSVREHFALRDRTGDPWDGRTLEWFTASPPPAFNFAALPNVTGEEAYWGIKQRAIAMAKLSPLPRYEAIEMPVNSPTGFVVAFFAVLTGFALIWHIWWMAAVGVAGAFATFVVFAWRDHEEYEVPVDEVEPDRQAEARGARGPGGGARARHPARQGRRARGDRSAARPESGRYDGPAAKAHRHRLRLLGLPAQRLRDVLGLLRRLTRCCRIRPPAGRGRCSSST